MTTEGVVAGQSGALADDEQHFCYRHPDRETWLRCGRCERPICTRYALQGPVGSRCKQCGRLAFDPLTSFTAQQLILGLGAAIALGAVAGFVASRLGFFAILVGFFAGGFIAEAVRRVTGYKRGPVMVAIVLGGIIAGTAVGFGIDYMILVGEWARYAAEFPEEEALFTSGYLANVAVWAVIAAGAACVGAYSRLRY